LCVSAYPCKRQAAAADYSAHPELAPDTPISGAEAFAWYVAHTLPLLRDSGPDDAFYIPPGHDAWIVGNEACVALDFTGAAAYAKK
jgi:hypothetical protein